jgi:hypothetical protein
MPRSFRRLAQKALLVACVVLGACSTASPVASSSPTPASSVLVASPVSSPSPSPSPFISPTPALPIGTKVPRGVLAPAKVLPVAVLCMYELTHSADGNVFPQFCRGGAVNVLAWRFYVPISSGVMSLGRGATLQDIQAALCRDESRFHATAVEEIYAYELSSAYYGWHLPVQLGCD